MKIKIVKGLLLFSFICLVYGCINKKSKKKLFSTKSVCNGLWREKFTVFSGGAHSAELYSDYLTDSVNFRAYIGTHDEHENFEYKCNGDSILVQKFTFKDSNVSTVLLKLTFTLSNLQKEHKFE